jgi:hypothetical protein
VRVSATTAPIVVDLGKQNSKTLRALKNGEGPLMEDVAGVLEEVRAKSSELAGKELVPVVIIYRRKPKDGKSCGMLSMPFGKSLPFSKGCT